MNVKYAFNYLFIDFFYMRKKINKNPFQSILQSTTSFKNHNRDRCKNKCTNLSKSKSSGKIKKSSSKEKKKKQRCRPGRISYHTSNFSTISHPFLEFKNNQKQQLPKFIQLKKHQQQIKFILNLMATKIQKNWRGYLVRKHYKNQLSKTNKIKEIKNIKLNKIGNNNLFNMQKQFKPLKQINHPKLIFPSEMEINQQLKKAETDKKILKVLKKQKVFSKSILKPIQNGIKQEVKKKRKHYEEVFIKNPGDKVKRSKYQSQIMNKKNKINRFFTRNLKLNIGQNKSCNFLTIEEEIDFQFIKDNQQQQKRRKKHKARGHRVSLSQFEKYTKPSILNLGEDYSLNNSVIINEEKSMPLNIMQKLFLEILENEKIKKIKKQAQLQNNYHTFESNQFNDKNDNLSNDQNASMQVSKQYQYFKNNGSQSKDIQFYQSKGIQIPLENPQNQIIYQNVSQQINPLNSEILSFISRNKSNISIGKLSKQIFQFLIVESIQELKQKNLIHKDIVLAREIMNYYQINVRSDTQSINSWLLEMAHYILDYKQQSFRNFENTEQNVFINILKQLRNCEYENNNSMQVIISTDILEEFQFFYFQKLKKRNFTKNVTDYKITREQSYNLIHFHNLCLLDCLNEAFRYQYLRSRKFSLLQYYNLQKKLPIQQNKEILQKVINQVSQWGQLQLGTHDSKISDSQKIQGGEQIYTIIEVLDIPLNNKMYEGKVIYQIWQKIFYYLIQQMVEQLKK